jgi:hypothetical protein
VRFEVLTEDSGLLAYDLLSICKLFVVSGPLQPLSSGSTKFENCIDLKKEVACPSETSVTLPVRDKFSKDLNLLQEIFSPFSPGPNQLRGPQLFPERKSNLAWR